MIRALLIIVLACVSAHVYANSFNNGIMHYRRADFQQAEKSFQDALRKGSNKLGLSKIYKYLGLAQYMLGKKQEAEASFSHALRYDPASELYPNEVLDSSVIEFFLSIKQSIRTGSKPALVAKPPPAAAPPKRRKSVPALKKKPPPPVVRKTPARLPAKKPAAKAPKPPHTVMRKKPVPKKQPLSRKQVQKKSNKRGSATTAIERKKRTNLFSGKKPAKVVIIDKGGKKSASPPRKELFTLPSKRVGLANTGGGVKIWHFLPFGVGQYVNSSSKLGNLFLLGSLGSVAGSVVYFILADGAAQERDDSSLKSLYNRCRADPDSEELKTKDCKEYITNYDSFVKEANGVVQTYKIISYSFIAAFASIWIGGAVEAVLNRPRLAKFTLLPEIHYDKQSIAFSWKLSL